jgi:hypothetical protein
MGKLSVGGSAPTNGAAQEPHLPATLRLASRETLRHNQWLPVSWVSRSLLRAGHTNATRVCGSLSEPHTAFKGLNLVQTALHQEGQRESERPPGSKKTPVAARRGRLRLVGGNAQSFCRGIRARATLIGCTRETNAGAALSPRARCPWPQLWCSGEPFGPSTVSVLRFAERFMSQSRPLITEPGSPSAGPQSPGIVSAALWQRKDPWHTASVEPYSGAPGVTHA